MAKLTGTDAHRDRIVRAALSLLTKHGRDAVTTRSVAEAAKVQPPVLYRLFGDKTGLLDAVTAYGFSAYLAKKAVPEPARDPVETLRAGWDLHVEFGLANPELYLLMYANPRQESRSPTAEHSFELLEEHMQRVAAVGRLKMSVARACALYHASAVGTVMSLLAAAPAERDLWISTEARELALTGITTHAPAKATPTIAVTANQLHALLRADEKPQVLSESERALLSEWLTRLIERNA